jgi:hypothetical protein
MESTPVVPVPTSRPGSSSDEAFKEALSTILRNGFSVYLRLDPDGAVLSIRSSEAFAFGKALETRWGHLESGKRAETVLGWIREAARYSRRPRIRYAALKDVASSA